MPGLAGNSIAAESRPYPEAVEAVCVRRRPLTAVNNRNGPLSSEALASVRLRAPGSRRSGTGLADAPVRCRKKQGRPAVRGRRSRRQTEAPREATREKGTDH